MSERRIWVEDQCKHGHMRLHNVFDPNEPPGLRDLCMGGSRVEYVLDSKVMAEVLEVHLPEAVQPYGLKMVEDALASGFHPKEKVR